MERVDEALLPAVYLYVSCALRASPAALGSITAARSLSQALTSPLGGVLGHYYNRCHVIAAACALWAVCTAGFAFSTSVTQAALLWAVNGAGLAAMIPNGQSLVADYYPPERRGAAFGCLLAVGAFVVVFSGVFVLHARRLAHPSQKNTTKRKPRHDAGHAVRDQPGRRHGA